MVAYWDQSTHISRILVSSRYRLRSCSVTMFHVNRDLHAGRFFRCCTCFETFLHVCCNVTLQHHGYVELCLLPFALENTEDVFRCRSPEIWSEDRLVHTPAPFDISLGRPAKVLTLRGAMPQLVAYAFPSIATSDSSHLRLIASIQDEIEM